MDTKYRLYAAPARASEAPDGLPDALRHRAVRRPVYTIAALVLASELPAPLSCAVRDLSDGGARLELDREGLRPSDDIVRIPDFIRLYFCPDRTEVDCRLAWQDGRHFGVQFLGPIHASSRVLS
ncbi:MAG: PilZ domain-containing protein [Bacteroidota bacterium]